MAAAIITVVEITRIGGTPDFTCKSVQVHLLIFYDLSESNSRWVHHRRHMGHVSLSRWDTILIGPTYNPFQNPNLPCNNCRFDTIHQAVIPRFKSLQLEVLPVLTSQEFIPNPYFEASIAFRNFQTRLHNAKRWPYLRVAYSSIANKRKFHHHRAA